MPALTAVTQGRNALENAAIAAVGGLPNDPDFRPEHAIDWALSKLLDNELNTAVFGMGRGADDTALFQTLVDYASRVGKPIRIPGGSSVLIRTNTGVILPSNITILGPGRIILTPLVASACRALSVGDPNSDTNTDKSNVVIDDGLEFYSDTDQEFLNFLNLENVGGDLTDVYIKARFTYKPPSITGGDRWACSFGGAFGDQRQRITLDHCILDGPMQLTANGGDADYTDLNIIHPIVRNGRNACIALSRRSLSAQQNTYKRIRIKGASLNTDRSLGIFLGGDSETNNTAPSTWDDIDIDDVTSSIEGAGGVTPIGLLFRAPEGASSVVKGFRVRNFNGQVSSNATIQVTYSRVSTVGTPPPQFEVDLFNCQLNGGDVLVAGTSLARLRGIQTSGAILPSAGAVVEIVASECLLRLEDTCTVRTERNNYVVRTASGRCVNVNAPVGKTINWTSDDDSFDTQLSAGNSAEAVRLLGTGTITAKLRHFNEKYTGWANGRFNLQNSQKFAELRPRISTLFVNTTAIGNVGAGEDDLMSFATDAGIFSAVKRGVKIIAWGTAANNANAKTVKIYFGPTVLLSFALTVSQLGEWYFEAEVVITSLGSNTQDFVVRLFQDGATQVLKATHGVATAVEENSVTIKCTGTATADNDVVQEYMRVEAIG